MYKDNGVDAIFVGNPLIDRVLEKRSFKVSNPLLIGTYSPAVAESVFSRHIWVILETAKILEEKNKCKICNV
ncbi:hypothetical protein [Candidatus Endomicrobiellum trichonymphae]|uniref:hypothetical protein n=1 Tax=Endomicrobium trichonymphae TaxID=1408204 RepID=UPI0013053397|nr:hypothetical protein [Candidatus Endomicrobium trichonymphae]